MQKEDSLKHLNDTETKLFFVFLGMCGEFEVYA